MPKIAEKVLSFYFSRMNKNMSEGYNSKFFRYEGCIAEPTHRAHLVDVTKHLLSIALVGKFSKYYYIW